MEPIHCVYDNPDTMRRELWNAGELVCDYSAELLFLNESNKSRSKILNDALAWKSGNIIGNANAIDEIILSERETKS